LGLLRLSRKTRKKQKGGNELVIQHNHLIEAKYHLTLQEKRLVVLMSSRIKKEDKEFQTYTFSIQELSNFLELNNRNIYKEIDAVVSKLFTRVLIIRNEIENSTTKISWLTYAKYWHGQGLIQLTFNQKLKPYLLDIKERFTQINIGDLIGLKSVYAMRILELLKQYESIGNRKIELNDLREYCGISQDQYCLYANFKRKVLEISKREINEKTDLLIDYKEIKTSRKVTAIQFSIKLNPNYGKTHFEKGQAEKAELITKELRSKNVLVDELMEYGFSKIAANRILKNNQESNVANAIKAVDLQVQKGKAKNPKAMLETAIKEGWHPEKYRDKPPKKAC